MGLQERIKGRWFKMRRQVAEAMGIGTFSRKARDGLDRKLAPYLPRRGVFVEAGANDGFVDSNTYYLEKIRDWTGVLVEPIYERYQQCVRRRTRSRVFHAALVEPTYRAPTIEIVWADRMSRLSRSFASEAEYEEFSKTVSKWLIPSRVEAPARTLNSILDEAKVTHIDFFSLDVEGYEVEALSGMDLVRFAPTWFLIECRTETALARVSNILGLHYRLESKLTHHDYLFHRHVGVLGKSAA